MRPLVSLGIAAWGLAAASACPRQAPDGPEEEPPPAPEVSIPEPVPAGAGLVAVSEFPKGLEELWQTGPLGEIADERARTIGDEIEGILEERVGIRVGDVDSAFVALVAAGAGEPGAVLGLRGADGELATPTAGARAEVPLHEIPGEDGGVMAMEADWFLAGDEDALGGAVDALVGDAPGLDRDGSLARVLKEDVGRAYFAAAADAAGAEALDPGGELDELARSFEVDAAALSLDPIDLRLVARGGEAGLERLNQEVRAALREPAEAIRAMGDAGSEEEPVLGAAYRVWLAGQLQSVADELEPRVRDGVFAASAPIGDVEPAAWMRTTAMWMPLGWFLVMTGERAEPPEELEGPPEKPEGPRESRDAGPAEPSPEPEPPDEKTRELEKESVAFMRELAEVGARRADDCDEVARRWRDLLDENDDLVEAAAAATDQTPADRADFEARYAEELEAITEDVGTVAKACADHEGVMELFEELSAK